jgi:hypothetical protein
MNLIVQSLQVISNMSHLNSIILKNDIPLHKLPLNFGYFVEFILNFSLLS